ncbi:MAG: hypothetical protein KAV82_12910 [Phycisphaerae bacterium]|nr:hypothetical protein [Phycisphaerae bacterium]
MNDDKLEKAIEAAKANLPREPLVVALLGEPYEDSVGEEALRIWVSFDDATTDKQIETAPIQAIKQAIMNSLTEHGIRLFPYFSFVRECEFKASRGDC